MKHKFNYVKGNTGRILYGIAILSFGIQIIYCRDFPYMLIPPKHSGIPGFVTIAYIFGAMLFLAGVCIVLKRRTGLVALLLGIVLLIIFCFYHVPYQFMYSPNYKQLGDWDNAEKELALAGGAFLIAGFYSVKNSLIVFGTFIFFITILSFGIDHFLYAKDVAEYISSWIPYHLFWTYLAGTALITSSVAIILNIQKRLAATLLGGMILIWFVILHAPKVITAPPAYLQGEITSAFLALAYSGIAFVIAGVERRS